MSGVNRRETNAVNWPAMKFVVISSSIITFVLLFLLPRVVPVDRGVVYWLGILVAAAAMGAVSGAAFKFLKRRHD